MQSYLKMLMQSVKANLTNEGEQALIRVVFLAGIFAYLLESHKLFGATVCGLYFAYSVLFLLLIKKFPKQNELRQWWALLVDLCMLSYGTYINGSAGGIFIGLFLWFIIGYGLRYGEKYTIVAFFGTLIGYCFSMKYNPYWAAHRDVVYGFFVTLVLVPLHTLILQRKLEKATNQAKLDSEAKSRFLSHISHEIRTPLNGIVGATDLLGSTKLNSEQKNAMYHIKNSAILLRQLVNDVLDISKIEQGKMDLHIAEFDLASLINDVDVAFRPQALAKGLRFSCIVEEGCPTLLLGDELHIKQVLINLVSNAVKFTNKGAVNLSVKQIAGEDTTLLISVKDTGIGINASKINGIFESFTQADSSIASKFGGTGLGTTIAKNLVDLMNGKLQVTSEEGVGSEFTVEIKLQKQAEPKPEPVASNLVSFQDYAKRHKKQSILIADDNLTNRYILNALLKQASYDVHEADDGDKALDMLEVMKFDLMMLDLNMPKLSGLEVFDIHKRLSQSNVPCVIITADATLETKQKCSNMGVDALLTKPYDLAKLLDTVKLLINDQASSEVIILEEAKKDQAIINLDQLLKLKSIGQTPDFMTNLICGFENDTVFSLAAMQKALINKEYQTLRNIAHAIKGNAASIGADYLGERCIELEKLKSSDNTNLWAAQLKDIESCWLKTRIELSKYIEKSQAV